MPFHPGGQNCGQCGGDFNLFSAQDWLDYPWDGLSESFQEVVQSADECATEHEPTYPEGTTAPWTQAEGDYVADDAYDWIKDGFDITDDGTFKMLPFANVGRDEHDYYGAMWTYRQDAHIRWQVGISSDGAGGTGYFGDRGGNEWETPSRTVDGGRGPDMYIPGESGYEGRSETVYLGIDIRWTGDLLGAVWDALGDAWDWIWD